MIEDSIMEKKINGRSTQLQPKTQVSDCKKNLDTVNKTSFRQSKKREVGNVPIKNDVRRTTVQSQKARFFDKRPRPRGCNNGAVGGAEDTGLNECEEAEFGSVFVQGSKKQNLNHLLNFHVAPRGSGQWQVGPRSVRPRQSHHQALVHSNVHRHNKELFLQSNCQFVVKANGDYSVHLVDPDIPVNWNTIEMIILHSPDGVLTCPICLCESQAARVTRCGHAYCWACVLHYLTLADPPGPRPCPVCSQPIDAQHLKSVQSVPQEFTNVGEVMQMRLMRRLRDSTIVEPAPDRKDLSREKNRGPNKDMILSLSDATPCTQYAKLLTADKTEVLNIIKREREELKFQLENEIDTTEVVYIERALQLLDGREIAINETRERRQAEAMASATVPILTETTARAKRHEISIDWFDVSGMDDVGSNSDSLSLSENGDKRQSYSQESDVQDDEQLYEELENIDFDEDNSKYYYFYQAADGQLVFLSGINQRMLYSSWGSEDSAGSPGLVRAPATISGKILHRLSGSVSIETRKKLRWLSHLPLHCPFDIVELELSPPAVTQEVLDHFRGELEERALRREKAERAERRRAQRIGRQQRKQLGYPTKAAPPPPLPAIDTWDAWMPLTPNQRLAVHDEEIPGPSPPQYKGPSFAKMASASGVWTVRPQPPTWQPASVSPPRILLSNFSDEDSDSAPAPSSYTMNLSDAITAALKNTSLTDGATGGAKKKKKLKPKLLFSSGI